ncbi:MAG: hypothetical protein ABSA01_01200 [Anaerolineales bacterium]
MDLTLIGPAGYCPDQTGNDQMMKRQQLIPLKQALHSFGGKTINHFRLTTHPFPVADGNAIPSKQNRGLQPCMEAPDWIRFQRLDPIIIEYITLANGTVSSAPT